MKARQPAENRLFSLMFLFLVKDLTFINAIPKFVRNSAFTANDTLPSKWKHFQKDVSVKVHPCFWMP